MNFYKKIARKQILTVKELKEALSNFDENAIVLVEDKSSRKRIDFIDCIKGNEAFGIKPQSIIKY